MYIYLVLVSICEYKPRHILLQDRHPINKNDHLSPTYLNFIQSLHSLIQVTWMLESNLNSSHPNLKAISDSAEACMEITIHLQGEVVFLTDIGLYWCPSLGQIRNCLIHLAIAMNHVDCHVEFQEWS